MTASSHRSLRTEVWGPRRCGEGPRRRFIFRGLFRVFCNLSHFKPFCDGVSHAARQGTRVPSQLPYLHAKSKFDELERDVLVGSAKAAPPAGFRPLAIRARCLASSLTARLWLSLATVASIRAVRKSISKASADKQTTTCITTDRNTLKNLTPRIIPQRRTRQTSFI